MTFFTATHLINRLFIISSLAPNGIKADNLWFKLSLGLTGQGITGQATLDTKHTNLYFDLMHYGFDYSLYKEAAKNHLLTLLKDGALDFRWIIHSFVRFLGSTDNQVRFGDTGFIAQHQALIEVLNAIGTGIFTLSILSSLLTIFTRRKIINNPLLIVTALIFGGYFFIYLVFEKQPRYRYEQYYALFLFGIPILSDILQSIVQKTKRFLFHELI